jgi:putative holliday junction resolvase
MTITNTKNVPIGRILAIDIGDKRCGLAISDELQITVRPLKTIHRTNWKKLLSDVIATIEEFDAKSMVIGLPINMDGIEGLAAQNVRRLAENFSKSVSIPVYLQDERLSTKEAISVLKDKGIQNYKINDFVDSEAAAIILRDFLAGIDS